MKTLDRICKVCDEPVDEGRSDRRVHFNCEKKRAQHISSEWYKRNREDLLPLRAKQSRSYRRKNPEKRLLAGAKQRAKERGLLFDLELSDIVVPKKCPALGVKMIIGTPYAPSLDRLDPTKGYVKGNIQVISWKANAMKQDATPKELRRFSKWVQRSIH